MNLVHFDDSVYLRVVNGDLSTRNNDIDTFQIIYSSKKTITYVRIVKDTQRKTRIKGIALILDLSLYLKIIKVLLC